MNALAQRRGYVHILARPPPDVYRESPGGAAQARRRDDTPAVFGGRGGIMEDAAGLGPAGGKPPWEFDPPRPQLNSLDSRLALRYFLSLLDRC